MTNIPTHKLSEVSQGKTAFVKYVSASSHLPATSAIDYAHRDNYYIFLFIEKGKGKLWIDFEEYELEGGTVRCVLPGQVHIPSKQISENGAVWVLGVDPILVKSEYKEIFERSSFIKRNTPLSKHTTNELKQSILIIQQRLKLSKNHIEESIMHDLLSYFIGLIAGVHYNEFSTLGGNRQATITCQFKSLLSTNYKSVKSPSQYAEKLHLSPVYLNEAVKRHTGMTVTECIQNEVIIQAKRLLFYTNQSVKEIASELGYEDCAYFTRLFTKVSFLSPTQFRKKYFK